MGSAWDKPDHMMVGINNVGAGWHELVRDLEAKLTELLGVYDLYQIKEKFGGLRYYIGPVDADKFDAAHALISEAEAKSFHICEECGKPGECKASRHWLKTLCEEHRVVDEANYKKLLDAAGIPEDD